MSASSTATLWPRLAMAAAREAVTVLLPTPPLPLMTAMTRLMLDLALAGAIRSREAQSALQEEQSCVQSDIVGKLLSAHTQKRRASNSRLRRTRCQGASAGRRGQYNHYTEIGNIFKAQRG